MSGSEAMFENKVETMFGREVDLERYNLATIYSWHALWFVIGGACSGFATLQSALVITVFLACYCRSHARRTNRAPGVRGGLLRVARVSAAGGR